MKYLLLLLSIWCSCINATPYASSIQEIDLSLKNRMIFSWKQKSPIPLKDLRYVKLLHYDFAGSIKEGELIVHHLVAQDIVAIFAHLFELKFPIERMQLIDDYVGEDSTSIEHNNCYAHCTRTVARQHAWSNHAYGLAIDINPKQNPYIENGVIYPKESEIFCDRSIENPGMILPSSKIYTIFKEHGWEWGGECFDYCQDLHHFQKIIPGLNKTMNEE